MPCQDLNNSICKLKCKIRGSVSDTLLFFSAMRNQFFLAGYMIVRRVFVVVLTNYVVDLTICSTNRIHYQQQNHQKKNKIQETQNIKKKKKNSANKPKSAHTISRWQTRPYSSTLTISPSNTTSSYLTNLHETNTKRTPQPHMTHASITSPNLKIGGSSAHSLKLPT